MPEPTVRVPATVVASHAGRLAGVRLVLLDIDGTLVTGADDTMENVSRQLRRLPSWGTRFTLATGRTLYGAAGIARTLRLGPTMPPVITYNGAVIARPDETLVVQRHPIPPELVCSIVEKTRSINAIVLLYSCQPRLDASPVERVFADTRIHGQAFVEPNEMRVDVVERLAQVEPTDVMAILVDHGGSQPGSTLATSKLLSGAYGEALRVTSSGHRFVELSAPGVSKLTAMQSLARIWRLELSEIMAVGDGFNDLEMIAGAGVGAAVANAHPQVKESADIVAARVAGEGVVQILRLLISKLRSARMQNRASNHG